MQPQQLTAALAESKSFFDRSTACLTEEDSTFAPSEDQYTVAQQVAHVAITIDWFLEGAFRPEGFDMDFDKHDVEVREFTSLATARHAVEESFNKLTSLIDSKTEEALAETLADGPVMGGEPRHAIVGAIIEHTAHHRGALTVYSRLRGHQPAMPYMDA